MTDQSTDRRGNRVPALDGLRGVACLMVFGLHSFQLAGLPKASLPWGVRQLVVNGYVGVDIFIVLSGFCLILPIMRAPDAFRTKTFYWRRIRRIVPAYYASIAYVVALVFLVRSVSWLLDRPAQLLPWPSLEQLATHLLFIHTLSPRTWFGINGSYWSLGLEAQFYLVLPLIVWGLRSRGVKAVIAAASVGVLTQVVLFALWGSDTRIIVPHILWNVSVLGRLAEFGAGMLAAWYVTTVQSPAPAIRRIAYVAPFAALLYLLALQELWFPPSIVSVHVFAVTFGFTLVGCALGRGVYVRALEWPLMTYFGLISYSFYLLHWPTLFYLSQLGSSLGMHGWANWGWQLTVGLLIVIVLASISFVLFEQAFLKKRHSEDDAKVADRYLAVLRPARGVKRTTGTSSPEPDGQLKQQS